MNGREAALLCILLALCLALSAAFKSRAATAEEQPAKLKREARELFRNVVERKTTEPGHCFLADSWLDYPVPEDVARQHLELTIHAELPAPSHGTRPPEVIDPDGAMPQAFCGESEARRQRDTLVESFRRGILKIDKGPFDLHPRLAVPRSQYSFPVFDASYRRAIIVFSYTTYDWAKISGDEVLALGATAGGEAEIYQKRDGLWRRVAREPLFSAH